MGVCRKILQRVGSLKVIKMSDKIKKLEFNLRTIEEGRLGRSEMWSIIGGATQCPNLTYKENCAHMLKSCGGGSNSKYVGNNCDGGTKGTDGTFTCNNCYWIKSCGVAHGPDAYQGSCGGGPTAYDGSSKIISWGGGASVTPHEIITELTLHSSLYIGSCEVFVITDEEMEEMQDMIVLQNYPNPFNEITTIECYIPKIIESAELQIYNVENGFIKNIDITERGTVSIEIHADELPSKETYTCLLTGDDKTSNEIQMILE